MKNFLCALSLIFFFSVSSQALLSESIVYGSSVVKGIDEDMWDKKNEAIKNAKKNLSMILARKFMSAEEIEENKDKIKKELLPYSDRFILSFNTLKEGLEQEGKSQSYNVRIKFKYSIDSFKELLKSKDILYNDLKTPKVAAFIEVIDASKVEIYKWWEEEKPRLHPALAPIQAKLAEALKEDGFELLEIRFFPDQKSFKEMAQSMGAHYYVNGSVRVNQSSTEGSAKPNKMMLTGGRFYFHETLSQRLASKVDVMEFKKALEKANKKEKRLSLGTRSIASVEEKEAPKKLESKDIIKDSFKDAARVLKTLGDSEKLVTNRTLIQVKGIKNPSDLKAIKTSILEKLSPQVSSLIERKVNRDYVSFYARTRLSPNSLGNQLASKLGLSRNQIVTKGRVLEISL